MDFKPLSHPRVITSNSPESKPSFFQKLRPPSTDFLKNKKLLGGVLTVMLLFAVGLGVYISQKPTQLAPKASSSGVSISLKPATISTSVNQEFSVDVFADPGTSNMQITAIQAQINYNPSLLELKNVTLKEFLPALLQPQNSSGSTKFAVGIPLGGTAKTTSGTVATLTFKALSSSSNAEITFDNTKTIIAATGQAASVATDFTPTTVSFNTSSSPSPASTTPETSFTLEGPNNFIPVGQEFAVKVYSRSDIDTANLWNAVISFPKDLVEVVRFDKTGSFITNWSEEYSNNSTGEISLTGGVVNPGFKTNLSNALMTTIIFKAKADGVADIRLSDTSAIYKNSDNSKITLINRDLSSVKIGNDPGASGKGDGNNDNKVDLQDLSILFSKWSPATDITAFFKLDFNDDKRLNSIDYTQLIALLTSLGVIK